MSAEPLLPTRRADWEPLSKCAFDFHQTDGDYRSPEMVPKNLIVVIRGQWQRTWIVRWYQRKVFEPFVVILRRGLEPRFLSLSAALGLTLGVFPVCGVTVILCAITAVLLGSNCHMPTLMLANFMMTPLELGLIVPFLRVGELVTHGQHFPLSTDALWKAITGRGSHALMLGILHAVLGWSIFAPGLVAIFYVTLHPIFRYLITRFGTNPSVHHELPISDHILIKPEHLLIHTHVSV